MRTVPTNILRAALGAWACLCFVGAATAQTVAPEVLSTYSSQPPCVEVIVDPGELEDGQLPAARAVEGDAPPVPIQVRETEPFWLVVVIECGPEAEKERAVFAAALASLASSLPPETQIGIVLAGETVRTVGFARGGDRLRSVVAELFADPVGRVRDGIVAAIDALAEAPGPRCMVVLHAGQDPVSHVARNAPAVLAPFAGGVIHSLSASVGGEPSVVEAARASGGQVVSLGDVAGAGAAAEDIASSLGRAVALSYQSPEEADGWRNVELLWDDDIAVDAGGYLAPVGGALTLTPVIHSPIDLPPTPIIFYEPGEPGPRGWILAGRPIALDEGLYRALVFTRPNLTRAVEMYASGVQRLGEMGALRVAPPEPEGQAYPIEIQVDGSSQRVGGARMGQWVPLPPGTYRVVSTDGPQYRSDRVGVVAGELTEVDLSDWVRLHVTLEGPEAEATVAFSLSRDGGDPLTGETNRALLAPPGSWDLRLDTRPPTEMQVRLEPGQGRRIDVPAQGAIRVELLSSDGQPVEWAWTARPVHNPDELIAGLTGDTVLVSPGRYEVSLAGWPDASLELDVTSGQVTTHSLGRLVRLLVGLLNHAGDPARVKYNVIDAVTGDALASGVTGRGQDILPGSYELDLWTYPRLLVTDLEIREAEDGVVQFGATGAVSLALGTQARIGLYRLTEGAEPEPAATLDSGELVEVLPGRYAVSVLSPQGASYDDEIVVRGGEVTRVELPPTNEDEASR
ncbi:MAG: hypothetical protein GF320_04190 [Armatimonadia bacterium]|nr:hypothetical protein [Armatimonadia bacterium]